MKRILTALPILTLALASTSAIAGPTPQEADPAAEKTACVNAYEQAQRDQNAGKLLEAKTGFTRCSTPTCPSVVQTQCAAALPELEASIPTVVFDARDSKGEQLPQTRVSVDGKPLIDHIDGLAVPMDPGAHKLVFETAGFDPVTVDVVVLQGQRSRAIEGRFAPKVIAPLKAVPTTRPFGVVPWIVGGGGIAVAIAGVGVLASGQSDISKASDACPNHRCASKASVDLGNGGNAKSIAGKVLLISGSAIFTGSLVWQLVGNRARPAVSSQTAALAFVVGPTGASLGASGAF